MVEKLGSHKTQAGTRPKTGSEPASGSALKEVAGAPCKRDALKISKQAATQTGPSPAEVALQAVEFAAGDGKAWDLPHHVGTLYSQAIDLAATKKEALTIARSAATHGYAGKADSAYEKALSLCKTRSEAMDVIKHAISQGYTGVASDLLEKANALP